MSEWAIGPQNGDKMVLKDLDLKKAYDSDMDDILNDFYVPVLSNSVRYKRLAGFFSSNALAISARGFAKFIFNGGCMQLICGAKLNKLDIEAIKNAYEKPEEVIERIMLKDLECLEDEFTRDHVRALGWMVANKRLEIKVAIGIDKNDSPLDENSIEKQGIFHQKVGILEDIEGNMLAFSGSENESASGWQGNIEEFKVFRRWINDERPYFEADFDKFRRFWNGTARRTLVIDIPTAVKEMLIQIAPENIVDLKLERWHGKKVKSGKAVKLWEHQNQAITSWLNNRKKGIFEMATGTGKTFAALGCLKKIMEDKDRLITVIACPYDHLIKQWIDDIREIGILYQVVIADSSNPGWKDELADCLLDINNRISEKLIVLTTHATFPAEDFIKIIRISNEEKFVIVDEVHGIGAPERRYGLIEDYHFRLGLSATSKRWFDIEGTERLFEYFGNTVFEFSLKDAIEMINPSTGETYLVPYEYKPYFIELTDAELEKYDVETKKIAKAYHRAKNDEEREKWFSFLCFKRQEIIKNAVNKCKAFREILRDMGEDKIKYCLVYCSPEQIDVIQDLLNEKNIIQHKFTLNEGTIPKEDFNGLSEREFLLRKFAEGTYQILVAIKCLDEGVDVPPARTAIILASTGNPREWIQRRGRILRRFPGKEKAIIYDVIVVPYLSGAVDDDLLDLERKILQKELRRYREFASIAINSLECLNKIYMVEKKFKV